MRERRWLQFLAGGILLYLTQPIWQTEARPILGPLSEERTVGLVEEWRLANEREPSPREREELIRSELDRDMLFDFGLRHGLAENDPVIQMRLIRNLSFLERGEGLSRKNMLKEARALQLHRGDEVIKGRVVQLAERLLVREQAPPAADEAKIQAAFETWHAGTTHPSRVTLRQFHLRPDYEKDSTELRERARRGEETFTSLGKKSLNSLLPRELQGVTEAQLRQQLGSRFVENLRASELAERTWVGPIESDYGTHLVWVENILPGEPVTLTEVRAALVHDLEAEARRRALQDGYADLRSRYEILIP